MSRNSFFMRPSPKLEGYTSRQQFPALGDTFPEGQKPRYKRQNNTLHADLYDNDLEAERISWIHIDLDLRLALAWRAQSRLNYQES